jgi:hypothetical protein
VTSLKWWIRRLHRGAHDLADVVQAVAHPSPPMASWAGQAILRSPIMTGRAHSLQPVDALLDDPQRLLISSIRIRSRP